MQPTTKRTQRLLGRIVVYALLAAVSGAAAIAHAQSLALDEVRTIAAPDGAVPVERSFTVTTTGTYEITLTDLGLPNSPLSSVRLAITTGATVVGTPMTAAGVATFTASSTGSYAVRVTGAPGQGAGSGLFSVRIRPTAGGADLLNFADALLPLSGSTSANTGVVNSLLNVAPSGSYTLTLRDLNWPQALTLLTAILAEEGGAEVARATVITNPAQVTFNLDATKRYRLVAVGSVNSTANAGLYSAVIRPASGGAPIFNQSVPAGSVRLVGSASLAAGTHVATLSDLNFPATLLQRGVNVVFEGQSVASTLTPGSPSFVAVAGPHQLFALAVAVGAAPSAGAEYLELKPQGQAPVLSGMQTAATTASGLSGFSYAVDVPAGNQRLQLADFQFPVALQSLRAAVVQNGAVLGTPLAAAGSLDVTTSAARLFVVVFAKEVTGGGLLGLGVAPAAGGAALLEASQSVGNKAFISRPVTINAAGRYDARLTDLAFPTAFTDLAAAVTRGTERVGQIFGGGVFSFQATPGNYLVNLIATPSSADKSGTYALTVGPAPPPPTVNLSSSATQVTTGSGVDLTWSSSGATSCVASGGWSGGKATNGTERIAAVSSATTFTLTCNGAGGSAAQNVSVTVNAAPSSSGGGGTLDIATLIALAVLLLARLRHARRIVIQR